MSESKQKLEMFQDQVILEICRLLLVTTHKQPTKLQPQFPHFLITIIVFYRKEKEATSYSILKLVKVIPRQV